MVLRHPDGLARNLSGIEHSSLFRRSVSDEKGFIASTPVVNVIKPFFVTDKEAK